jgi:putative transposase
LISNVARKNERESAPFSVVNHLLTEDDEDDPEAMRKDYRSDVTDSQWHNMKAVLNTSRRCQHDLRRDILDAMFYVINFYVINFYVINFYVVKTGGQWRMLPGGFAPWQTVYYYFRTWNQRGGIAHLLSIARRGARKKAGREPEPSAVNQGVPWY